MEIREGTPDDAALMREIYAPYVRETAISFEEDVPSVDEMRDRIETVLDRHMFFAAEENGVMLGYAYAAPFRQRPAYRFAAEVSVYVAKHRRSEGMGTALYNALLPWLSDRGYHCALAALTLPNAVSVRLHESAGFKKVAHYVEVGRKFDEWHDVGWWQKVLTGNDDG